MSQGVYSTGPAAGSGTEATTVTSRERRMRWTGAVRFLRGMWKGRRGAEKWEEVVGVAVASNDMAKGRASGREEAVAAPAPDRNDRKRGGICIILMFWLFYIGKSHLIKLCLIVYILLHEITFLS